ncbi:MAG: FecR domain-containing protein [Prolixibacteraceae bacterium]|nr:FecR domain-containing protein [Burkholderiales bacterium]
MNGDIRVISASGAERKPIKGEVFNAGETIITGPGGSAQIRMTDGGFIAIRPDTQMKLDQYVFNGREDGSERKLVSLIKGGFRAITGLIGNRNKENYRIITPSATIGIRGTDHEAVVIPPGAAGGFQVGTYDRVYRGATIIETDKGKLIVNPNQVGFSPGKGVAPVLLPKIPEFYDTRLPKPDVARDTQKESKDSDGGDSKRTDANKDTPARSLGKDPSAIRDLDSKEGMPALRSPLDAATVKDAGATTLKTDGLTPISPLKDPTIRSTTPTSTLTDTSTKAIKTDTLTTPILTAPTTTLRSEILTAPISTAPLLSPTTTNTTTPTIAPIKTPISPITTTISPITTTAPIATTAPLTTTVPLTTTIQKTAPIPTAPLTTTITR